MGEPMIYSVRPPYRLRRSPLQYFRNKQYKSIFKCYFPEYAKKSIACVLIVRFYVSPGVDVSITREELKREKIPATRSHEMSEYVLSFLEMFPNVLVSSQRQFAKIDAEKFYSSNPRTVFKFMKWEHYVKLKADNTLDTKAKRVSTAKRSSKDMVQSFAERNAKDKTMRCKLRTRKPASLFKGAIACRRTFRDTSIKEPDKEMAKRTTSKTPLETAGRRQFRKISG